MISFLKKLLVFCSIAFFPLLLLLIGYLYFDPFKVLRKYTNYSNSYVAINRDYVSTQSFINNNKKQHYNSFIFGSSRTSAFSPSSWKKHLNDSANIFLFDASSEAIYGIYTKLKYLDKINANIDNALILFCRDAIFKHTKNFKDHLGIKHPATSGESKLFFHYVFIKAYLNNKFLSSFYDYTTTHKFKTFMTGYIEQNQIIYDSINNGQRLLNIETQLSNNPEKYYQERGDIFLEERKNTFDSSRINETSLKMLNEIKRILTIHHTNYKIILSPIYDQMKFSKEDFAIMKNIFGESLYDFTGENFITNSKYNWYETKHFRPFIGDSILNVIYSK